MARSRGRREPAAALEALLLGTNQREQPATPAGGINNGGNTPRLKVGKNKRAIAKGTPATHK